MSAVIIDVSEQVQTGDPSISSLKKMFLSLLGEPFLFARFSYGEELTLHFGVARDAKNSALRARGIKYGSYILRTRGSGWLLKSGSKGNMAFSGGNDHLNPAVLASELQQVTDK